MVFWTGTGRAGRASVLAMCGLNVTVGEDGSDTAG